MASDLPKHRRVYAALRHDILIGKYDAEAKFPSEGMLMRRFGVSRITIRQAMTDLKKDGFLEARSGSGTYLSALARHATGMIGLVIPDYSSRPFFKRLGDELVKAGKSAGYTMLLGELPGNTPAERAHEAISPKRQSRHCWNASGTPGCRHAKSYSRPSRPHLPGLQPAVDLA